VSWLDGPISTVVIWLSLSSENTCTPPYKQWLVGLEVGV
jgi:hypothetical protein